MRERERGGRECLDFGLCVCVCLSVCLPLSLSLSLSLSVMRACLGKLGSTETQNPKHYTHQGFFGEGGLLDGAEFNEGRKKVGVHLSSNDRVASDGVEV